MDAIRDFEDMLAFLERYEARYLIIGGLAFIYHAKPRYTKDMDLWVEPSDENVRRANKALAEFGSPHLFDLGVRDQVLQIGVAPNRIDLLLDVKGLRFDTAWKKRVRDSYGGVTANWIGLDSLIRVKQQIDHPRHQEDARVLREVRRLRRRGRG
ncbi:MAG TPA: hypothetical protein VNE39_10825 [Planctomycetota bacterium]|nr:hypothetical protein [Planctomycetota bacterium]